MPPLDPGGNFDDELKLYIDDKGDVAVRTEGPLGNNSDLREICVWVFQRKPGELNDVAATEMSTTLAADEREEFFATPTLGIEGRRWKLPSHKLDDETSAQLGAGPAVAMAIGFFRNHENGQFKVLQWAQSVVLAGPSSSA
jgi:hypothetical protein